MWPICFWCGPKDASRNWRIRAALGAGRRRIAGELLFESVIIGLIGSVLGLALAYGALRFWSAMAPAGLPRIQDIGIECPY